MSFHVSKEINEIAQINNSLRGDETGEAVDEGVRVVIKGPRPDYFPSTWHRNA